MNRRNFFGRMGGTLAAAAAARTLIADERLTIPPTAVVNPPAVAPIVSPDADCDREAERLEGARVDAAAHLRARNDARLRLYLDRKLAKPCPNKTCGGIPLWVYVEARVLQCVLCGWKERDRDILLRCGCRDCNRGRSGLESPEIEIRQLSRADPGAYRLVEDGQRVTRVELNAYDINTDGFIHNAVQQQFAYVYCALRAADGESQFLSHAALYGETDHGDTIYVQWQIEDCDEWKENRRKTQERLARGTADDPSWTAWNAAMS